MQERCKRGAEMQEMCRRGAVRYSEVQRCTEVQERCRGAGDIQSRCSDVHERCRGGAEMQ